MKYRAVPWLSVMVWSALSTGCIMLGSCIARGARVDTPRGTRRIEALDVGDEVYCLDPTSHERIVSRITRITRAMRECARLHLEGGVTLMLTADHPVYDPDQGIYSPASDWLTGKRTGLAVWQGSRLERRAVIHTEVFAAMSEVFDLSVEHTLHNFVVEGVLVHNKDGGYGYYNEEAYSVLTDECWNLPEYEGERIGPMVKYSERPIAQDDYIVTGVCNEDVLELEQREDALWIDATGQGQARLIVQSDEGEEAAITVSIDRPEWVEFHWPGDPRAVRHVPVSPGDVYELDYSLFNEDDVLLYALHAGIWSRWYTDYRAGDGDAFMITVDRERPHITVSIGDLQQPLTLKSLNGTDAIVFDPG